MTRKTHSAECMNPSGPAASCICNQPGTRSTQQAQGGTPEQKHTPGPWRFDREDCMDNAFWIDGADQTTVARCSFENENAEANARLIASAPALLAERDALKVGRETDQHTIESLADQLKALKAEYAALMEAKDAAVDRNLALKAERAELVAALLGILGPYRVAMQMHGRAPEDFEASREVVAARAALAKAGKEGAR